MTDYPVVEARWNATIARRQASRSFSPAGPGPSPRTAGDVFIGEPEQTIAHAVIRGFLGGPAATPGLFSKLERLRYSTRPQRRGSPFPAVRRRRAGLLAGSVSVLCPVSDSIRQDPAGRDSD